MSFADHAARMQRVIADQLGYAATYQFESGPVIATRVTKTFALSQPDDQNNVVEQLIVLGINRADVPTPRLGAVVVIGAESFRLKANNVRDDFHGRYIVERI